MWGGMGVGVGRWVWGGGCGEVGVGVGVGMENPTPVQNFTYLEPQTPSFHLCLSNQLFSVIAVWSAKQIRGCGEVCVGVVVWSCGCGCEELWVWGGAFEEVGVGRWVWGGGCGLK